MKQLSALLILALWIAPANVLAAENDVQTTKIRDNIHLLVSPQGGNVVASTGEDGTFIIDDQLSGREKIIENAIKGINDSDIKFILNTHFHFDHTGGNETFGGNNAIIVAHDNVRKRLNSDQFITYFKKEMPALSKTGLPVVTFADGMTLHYNNDDIKFIHLPAAHTDGDVAAYFTKNNVIAAGDTVFNGMYPFIDTEHGGSLAGVIKAQGILLSLADDKTAILPGHGTPMTKAELQTYRDMLTTIHTRISDAVKDGKTLEQTIATKPTKEFDASTSKGFIAPDAFVTLIYKSLNKK